MRKSMWPQINEKAIKAKPEEEAIASHIMTIMRDRDVVQLGIGSLPSACVGAAIHSHKIYAFSHDTVYRADVSAQRFSALSLPAEMNGKTVTGYLGMLANGVALVHCDSDVYAVTLP